MKQQLANRLVWPWVLALLVTSIAANVFLVGRLRTSPSPAGDTAQPAAIAEPTAAAEDRPAVRKGSTGALVRHPTQPGTSRNAVSPTGRATTSVAPSHSRAVRESASPVAVAQVAAVVASQQSVPQAVGQIPNTPGETATSDETSQTFSLTTPQTAVAGVPSGGGYARAPVGEGGSSTVPPDANVPGAPSVELTGSGLQGGGPQAAGGNTYEQRVSEAAAKVYDILVGPNLGEEITPTEAAARGVAPSKRLSSDASFRAWVSSERFRRTWSEEMRLARRAAIAEANRRP